MAEFKGHAASPKKLKELRREGRVARSPLLTQSIVTLAGFASFIALLPGAWSEALVLVQAIAVDGFSRPELALERWVTLFLQLAGGTLLSMAISGILIELYQVGVSFEWGILSPKLERLNPASGLYRVATGIYGSWIHLIRLALALAVWGWFFATSIDTVPGVIAGAGVGALDHASNLVFWCLFVGCGVFASSGAVGYLYNRTKFLNETSMSRDELVRESKSDEGDPHVKHSRRALHAEMTQDVVKRVRRSKVIVVERA